MAGSDSNVHHKMILEVGKIQQTVELMLNRDLSPTAAYRSLDKLCHGLKEQVAGYVNASNAQRVYNHDPRQYHQLPPHMNPPPGPPPQGHPHMNQQHQPMMLGPGYHHPQQPPPPPPGMFAITEIPHQYSPSIEYGPPGNAPDQRPPLTEKPIPQQTNQIVESTSQSVSGKEETALAIVRKVKQGSSKKKNVKRIKMDLEKLNKEQMHLPYQCMLCHKRFATNTQNKRHQLTHIKPYSCTTCGHKSAEKVKIRLHCWKTHGNRDGFKYTAPECSTDPDPEGEGQVERNENDEDSCDSYDLDITSNGDEDIDDSMDPLGGISPGKSSRSRDEDDKEADEKPFMYFGRSAQVTENYEDLS